MKSLQLCCAFGLLFALAAGQDMTTCSETLTAGSYVVSFSADGDSVAFNASAPSTGWVAIGFSNDRQMPNTDVVLGASNGVDSFINDRFANARARPPIDASQDITDASAETVDGTTTIRFTRPRASADSNDISLDQCRFFLWAWGGPVSDFTDPNAIARHSSRGSFADRICIPDNCVNGELPADCGPLDAPENGQIMLPATIEGSVATYSCDVGYFLVGNEMRVCQANGTWSGEDPFCQIVTCPALIAPDNGAVDDGNMEFQTVATYTCDPGFGLLGNMMRTCQADGTWSGEDPMCINVTEVDCGPLEAPLNGTIFLPSTGFEAMATYACDDGFMLVGPETRTCQLDGEWSGEDPMCVLEDGNGAGLTQGSLLATIFLAVVGTVAALKF